MIKKIEKIILITFTMLFLAIICSQIVKAGTVNKGDVFMTFKRAMLPENNDNEKGYYCLNDNRSFKTYNATGQWMSTGFEKLDKKTVKLDLNEAGYVIINDREKSTKDTELAHMVWFFKEHGKEASHKNTDGFPGTDSQKYLWKKAESWLKEDGLHYGLKVTGGANVSFDTTEMDNEAEKWINKLVKQAKIKKTEGSEEPKIEYKKAKGLYIIGPFNYTFGKDNLKAGDNLEEGETLDAEYKDIEVKGAKNWYLSTENGNEKETVESGKNFYIAAKKLTTSEVQVKINVKIKTYKATIQVYKSTGYIKDSDGKIKPYRDGNGDLIKHQNMIKGNVEKDSDVITKKITVTSGKYHAYIGVRKNDEYGNSLAGATFTVYKGKSKNGTALGTITTASNTDKYGSNGDRFVEITIDDLDDLPLNYYIYETKVPSGYKSNGRGQVVTLTKDDVDTIIVPIDKKPSDRIIKTFTNYKYEGPTITQDENTIKIYKTEKTDSGEEIPLSGVTFELRVKNGLTTTGTDGTETTSDWVQEVTTEDNGIASYKFSTEDTFLKAFDTEYTVEVSEKEFNNNDLSDDLFGYERDDTVYEIKVKKTKKCKNIKTTIDEKTGETKEDHSLVIKKVRMVIHILVNNVVQRKAV